MNPTDRPIDASISTCAQYCAQTLGASDGLKATPTDAYPQETTDACG